MHRIKVIENFITAEDADLLIREQKNPSSINPYPEYYSKRFGGTSLPYNPVVQEVMIKYGLMANQVHQDANGFKNPIYVFKGFGSHWVPGTKGAAHIDAQDPEPWIEFSTIIYLNDDFEGGEIYFPNQDFVYKPKKYSAVFFPSAGSEYIHGITTITKGDRYTALYMHTSLPKNIDVDYHPDVNKHDWKAMRYHLSNA